MARDRPGRPNPQGPRNFLDPASDQQQMELRRPRRFRNRNSVDGPPRGLGRFCLACCFPSRQARASMAELTIAEAAMRDRVSISALILAVAAGVVGMAAWNGGGRAAPTLRPIL